jgi:choline dehydrogenase-like flavoprotein
MLDYDVIVCGAGPAGAAAAAEAAGCGLKVALLEKYPLPRHKTCGGGMPMVIEDFLRDLAPDAFVESKVRYMRHTWKFGDPYLASIADGYRDFGFDDLSPLREAQAEAITIARRAERATWFDNATVSPPWAPPLAYGCE